MAAESPGREPLRLNAIYGKVKQGGGYNFSELDSAINEARTHGLDPQLTLMGTPRYNPTLDQRLSYKNADPKEMQRYAYEAAKHFKGRVGRYSIWNEPNHDAFIEGALNNPKKAGRTYRKLYQGGQKGIKQGDKAAQVLLGEVTSSTGAQDFLKSVLAGKPLKASGFAYHPYDLGGKGWNINNLPALQKTLAKYKKQGKLQTAAGKQVPLYLTEMGYLKDGRMTDAQRLDKMADAYGLANNAGAKQ